MERPTLPQIAAGRMTQRVTLQRPSPSRNAFNEVETKDDSFIDVTTVWAEMEWLGGREFQQGGETRQDVDVKVKIRFFKDLDATWRIKHKGNVLNIQDMGPVGSQNVFMQMLCQGPKQ